MLVGDLKGEGSPDASNGEEKWRARVTSEVLSAPATNGDVVVVQTQDDRLIAFDASTGEQRWIYENSPAVLTLRGTSSPVMTNRMVIAGLSTGKLLALDASRAPGLGAARGHPAGPFRTGARGRHRRQSAALRRQPVCRDPPGQSRCL